MLLILLLIWAWESEMLWKYAKVCYKIISCGCLGADLLESYIKSMYHALTLKIEITEGNSVNSNAEHKDYTYCTVTYLSLGLQRFYMARFIWMVT